jgi:hypothetical protein
VSLPWTCRSGLQIHFAGELHLRLTLSHTLTQHSTFTLLPEPERHGFIPKGGYSGVSLGVDQTYLLPPEAGLNSNLGSYQSYEQGSQDGSQTFPGSFVLLKLTSSVHWEKDSLPLDQYISGTWQGHLTWQAGVTEPATR